MDSLRTLMPVTDRFAYLDHAAVSPLPVPTRETIQRWLNEASNLGVAAWPKWEERVDEVRQLAALLIGAQAAEIAFVPNTTTGIGFIAEGFPWQSGDSLVVPSNEFPSNLYPWMNLSSRGVEIRQVPPRGVCVEVDDLIAACDSSTRILAVSWVGFATGWRIDMDELVAKAHNRGVLVFLDAIQGLGVFPLDVGQTQVDFLAADGHKWLLSPEGCGLLYVRAEHLNRLRPIGLGWNSVVHPHDFSRIDMSLRNTAARYEGGTRNMMGTLAIGSSLRVLQAAGLSPQSTSLANSVLETTKYASDRLRHIGAQIISDRRPHHASGIVAFDIPGRDCRLIRKQCLERDVVLSCRNGWLRISPHAYSNHDDIDRLIVALLLDTTQRPGGLSQNTPS